MSKIVAERMTITLNHVFVPTPLNVPKGASFQPNLQVGFDADEVILRFVSYGNCTTDNRMSYIQTDLIKYGEGVLCPVYGDVANTPLAFIATPNSRFTVNKSKINAGQSTFNIFTKVVGISVPGVLIIAPPYNEVADGTLTIALEFIRYETK